MKQEDKELLLQDLCARLPYKVRGERIWTAPVSGSPEKGIYVFSTFDSDVLTTGYHDCGEHGFREVRDYSFKPYLFPLSSMTGEQKEELESLGWNFDNFEIHNVSECFGTYREYVAHSDCFVLIDWLNKNHFDYNGLIERGLAIDATGLNIY